MCYSIFTEYIEKILITIKVSDVTVFYMEMRLLYQQYQYHITVHIIDQISIHISKEQESSVDLKFKLLIIFILSNNVVLHLYQFSSNLLVKTIYLIFLYIF